MRAGRLLKVLMTLQTRDKVTARELADACETSVRTLYRDIEALSEMGVPVYSERGSDGGYRLLDGYRTRLNGLSAKEAEALFLAGIPGPAKDLGLYPTLADAQLKLHAALPEKLRQGADRLQSRFLLDVPDWFSEQEKADNLPGLMTAVLDQRRIQMNYRSWKGERERVVDPLGVVLKSGAWYMVARCESDLRTFRVTRIRSLTVLDETFERPEPFHLAEYWQASQRALEEKQYPVLAELRLSEIGMKILSYVSSTYAMERAEVEPPDDDGWRRVTIPVVRQSIACHELLRFGPEVEVLGPPELREDMTRMVTQLAGYYRTEG